MALPRIFRTPQHSKFNYKPIYYDPKKEELEKKREQYRKEKKAEENGEGEFKPRIKGTFSGNFHKNLNDNKKSMNLRIFLIIIFLSAILYLLLSNSALLGSMFDVLFK